MTCQYTPIEILGPFNNECLQSTFDQLAQASRDHPLLIQISATAFPLNLFHFVNTASASSTALINRRILDTTLLINKICEMIFLHPRGSIACVIIPSSGHIVNKTTKSTTMATATSNQQLQKQQGTGASGAGGGFFLSGPLLAFAAACSYKCLPTGLSLWFGDVSACSLLPYGGLSHTVREWLGASLVVPVLVQGLQVPSSLIAKVGRNTSANMVSPAPESVRVLEDFLGKEVSVSSKKKVGEDARNVVSTSVWDAISSPQVRLSQGYGTLLSGVAWLKARKTLRVQLSISNSSRGRKGVAEVATLKLLTQKNNTTPMAAGHKQPAGGFVGFIVKNEMNLFKSYLSEGERQAAQSNIPAYLAVYEKFYASSNETSSFTKFVPETSSLQTINPLRAKTFDFDHLTDPTEYALQLQRLLRVRGDLLEDQVRVYSFKQALIAFGLEQSSNNNSSMKPPLISILLWDAPINFEGTNITEDSLNFNSRYASELRSRAFVPEISFIDDNSREIRFLVGKVIKLLSNKSGSYRLAPPVLVPRAFIPPLQKQQPPASNSRIVDIFPSLHLFAQLVRQAMLLVEDGAYPIVVHKALQSASAMTPTIFDRIDRDCPDEGLRIISQLVAVSNEKMMSNFTEKSNDAVKLRRTGTDLLDKMADLSLTNDRFKNFFRSFSSTTAMVVKRHDDVDVQKLVAEISMKQERPRRIVSDEEITLRMLLVAANFAVAPVPASTMQVSDRLCGCVLGLQATQGGTPLFNFKIKQFQSLRAIFSSKEPTNTDDNPKEFANRIQVFADGTGMDSVEMPSEKLVRMLKEMKGVMLAQRKSKL